MQAAQGSARLVLSTVGDAAQARSLARALVDARLAACVSMLPGATSIYRWQGALEESAEVLLLIKTSAARLGELERVFARLHPYEVPEFVVLDPVHVAPAYLAWLQAEVADGR